MADESPIGTLEATDTRRGVWRRRGMLRAWPRHRSNKSTCRRGRACCRRPWRLRQLKTRLLRCGPGLPQKRPAVVAKGFDAPAVLRGVDDQAADIVPQIFHGLVTPRRRLVSARARPYSRCTPQPARRAMRGRARAAMNAADRGGPRSGGGGRHRRPAVNCREQRRRGVGRCLDGAEGPASGTQPSSARSAWMPTADAGATGHARNRQPMCGDP